jgi:hypothetical protein
MKNKLKIILKNIDFKENVVYYDFLNRINQEKDNRCFMHCVQFLNSH